MKRHLTASTMGIGAGNESVTAVASVADRAHSPTDEAGPRHAAGERTLTLASVRVWTHTLVLTGELNHRSAHVLESAIERLCEEGVTGVTLDLRQLERIDATGVAVIAFRSALCKRRGYDFKLIAGPPEVHSAFMVAGVADSLPFQDDDEIVERSANGLEADWGSLTGDHSATVVRRGDAIMAASRLGPATTAGHHAQASPTT